MLNFNELATKEIGISEFIDSKSRTHTVKHSVVLTETEKQKILSAEQIIFACRSVNICN